MTRVLLSLGSNQNPVDNLGFALDSLLLQFRDIALSPVFESEALGQIPAPAYLNLVAALDTDLGLADLNEMLKKLESKLGRQRDKGQQGVPLDIDILTYGKLTGRSCGISLPRPELAEAAYVLWPVAVLAPKELHPVLKQTYAQLWQAFDKQKQSIAPVDFYWHERQISSASLK